MLADDVRLNGEVARIWGNPGDIFSAVVGWRMLKKIWMNRCISKAFSSSPVIEMFSAEMLMVTKVLRM